MHTARELIAILLYPVRNASAWIGLIFISAIFSGIVLLIMKLTLNRAGLRAARDRAAGRRLEMLVFADNPAAALRAAAASILETLRSLRFFIIPTFIMIIPFMFFASAIDSYFRMRPPVPGEAVVVSVKYIDNLPRDIINSARLTAPSPVRVETPGVRDLKKNEVSWRVRAAKPGDFILTVTASLKSLHKGFDRQTKTFKVSKSIEPVSTNQSMKNPLIKEIRIHYPHRYYIIGGHDIHPILIFIVLSFTIVLFSNRIFRIGL